MSCDAVLEHGDHTDPTPFFPGAPAVDWWGINVFNRGSGYNSLPSASCVLDFVDEAGRQGFPVLVAESLPRFVAGVTAANSWETWFGPFFRTLLANPAVRGFSYIDRDCGTDPAARKGCVGGQWGDARLEGPGLNATVGPCYAAALRDLKFVHGCSLACIEKALGLA